MVGSIALQMVKSYMPRIEHTVAHERHFLPMRKRTRDFHGAGIVSMTIRQAPPEYLGKDLSSF